MALSKTTGVFAMRTTTGDDTVALGFADGKAIWLWATLNTSQDTAIGGAMLAQGISDGTTHYSIAASIRDAQATTEANRYHANKALIILNGVGALIAECTASFSGSNLVLNWTTVNGTAYLIHYLVLGGSDLTNAKVINSFVANTTSPSTAARTGFGFAPDFISVITNQDDSAAPAADNGVSNAMGFAANKATNRRSLNFCILAEDLVAASSCFTIHEDVIGVAEYVIDAQYVKAGIPTSNGRFKITSWDADGYTETWDGAAGAAWHMGVLALKGLQYDLIQDLCPTSTGNDAQTGFGFQPEALLTSMSDVRSGASSAGDVNLGLGAAVSTTTEHAAWLGDNTGAPVSESDQRSTATYHLLRMMPGTPTLDVQASLVSFDADGFTQNFATVPATAAYQGWVAFGAAAAAATDRRRLLAQVV